MMDIPNEHQLKFNSIKDAKKSLEAVEKRFGGNATTRKTQRNLLKPQYENFTAPSSEMLDQTFDRLQKLVSQNKADLDTMSMDDLYNNLKVYEPKVKGMSSSISTASTQVNAANSTNIDNLSDAVIYAFFASQPNSPQLVHEDLQQIHTDDMEEMDLRWQMAMLTQRYQLLKDLKKSELMVLGYKTGLESVEEKLKVYKANESIYLQDIKGLKFEIHIGEITIKELRKKLEIVQKAKDGIQLNVDKFKHASKSLNKLIECQIVDNCKKGLGYENYNAVPPPYTGNFMPPTHDLSFTGLDDFVNEPAVENCKAMSSEEEPKIVRKCDDAPSIEE
ncbi:hypothetical protein Tco_0792476 [Tanacetum coccineum]